MQLYYKGTYIEPREGDQVNADGEYGIVSCVGEFMMAHPDAVFIKRGAPVAITCRDEAIYVLQTGGAIESGNGQVINQRDVGLLVFANLGLSKRPDAYELISKFMGQEEGELHIAELGDMLEEYREEAILSLVDSHYPERSADNWIDICLSDPTAPLG